MANLFLQNPVYITIDEIKETSTKAWLIALSDNELKVLITKAQKLVDNYIISYGEKYDEDQTYIFPIKDSDDNSFLPNDITVATFYTVEQIWESGDLISGAVSTTSGWAITQEKVWDRSVSYSSDTTTTTNNNLKFLWIPPEAESILKKYRNLFIKTVI